MNCSEKKKYLSWVPGQYFGGCEAYALRMALKAEERGWDVSVICVYDKCFQVFKSKAGSINIFLEPELPEFKSSLNKLKSKHWIVKLLCNFYNSFHYRLHLWGRSFILSPRYDTLLKNENPDVVHAILPWHFHSDIFLLSCNRANIPSLVTFQLVPPSLSPSRSYVKTYKKLSSRMTKFCAISENNRSLIQNYYGIDDKDIACVPNRPEKIQVNSISEEFREKLRLSIGCTKTDILILTVGALAYQKGYDLLISAIPQIIEKYKNIRFIFAGEGALREKLFQLSHDLGVSDSVSFLGKRDDISELLHASEYFLFPTRYEGESFALLEAAVAGIPIVASKASGIPETFRDGVDALLFDVEDVSGISEKMILALSDPIMARKRAESARLRVFEYQEDNMFRDTFALINEISR